MAKLKEYEVNINGIRHTLQLDAETAEQIGATEVVKNVGPRTQTAAGENDISQAPTGAESKSGKAPIEPAEKDHSTPEEKAATARANKARGTSDDLKNK